MQRIDWVIGFIYQKSDVGGGIFFESWGAGVLPGGLRGRMNSALLFCVPFSQAHNGFRWLVFRLPGWFATERNFPAEQVVFPVTGGMFCNDFS